MSAEGVGPYNGNMNVQSAPCNLREAISSARCRSRLATWLVSTAPAAVETLPFLEHAFTLLANESADVQRRVAKKLAEADPDNVDAVLVELLVFKVCHHFKLNPVYEPKLGKQRQTPDFSLQVGSRSYLAEVFYKKRPERTRMSHDQFIGLRRSSPPNADRPAYREAGETAHDIAERINEKAHKYAALGVPLVLFVVFGGRDVETWSLETALYGNSVDELFSNGGLTTDCHSRVDLDGVQVESHGVLCPPGEMASRRWLSAVVACDWFDTLSRDNPGRRLHCIVYHHWQPDVEFPVGLFGCFPEVHWRRTDSGRFIPTVTGVPNLVMNTTGVKEPEFRPYSPAYSPDRPYGPW